LPHVSTPATDDASHENFVISGFGSSCSRRYIGCALSMSFARSSMAR
jgi:hypothetical protein